METEIQQITSYFVLRSFILVSRYGSGPGLQEPWSAGVTDSCAAVKHNSLDSSEKLFLCTVVRSTLLLMHVGICVTVNVLLVVERTWVVYVSLLQTVSRRRTEKNCCKFDLQSAKGMHTSYHTMDILLSQGR